VFGVTAGTRTLGTGATTLGDGARVGLALGAADGTGEGMTLGVVAGTGSMSTAGPSASAISSNILVNLARASCRGWPTWAKGAAGARLWSAKVNSRAAFIARSAVDRCGILMLLGGGLAFPQYLLSWRW
jgi:hypothetical protein